MKNKRFPSSRVLRIFLLVTATMTSSVGWTQTAPATSATPAAGQTLSCAPAGAVQIPAGLDIARIEQLDKGLRFKVYTSVEAVDERDPTKNLLPASLSQLVDVNPSALNRILFDFIARSKRFQVYDMRPGVTAEQSDVLVTAKMVDADQVLKPHLEGGRRVSESRVKLSLQVKNMLTGENLLTSDAFVEGKTGTTSGDRVVVTSAEDENSAGVKNRLAIDFKNAMYRAFEQSIERVEALIKPMARVVGAEECRVDLFGGTRMGIQAKDEVVVVRAVRRQLGETTIVSGQQPVALLRCDGVGTDSSSCQVIRSVAGRTPQDGDYVVVTDESMKRTRQQ